MSYQKQYLQNARNFANETYLNADGFFEDDSSYFTANEDFFSADGMPMAAPAPMASVPTSQPYIVNVTLTGAAVANFTILNSYTYALLGNTAGSAYAWQTNGDLLYTVGAGNTVRVSSGISNVTYQQMLNQFAASPFSVGLTYISGTAAQIVQSLNLTTQDANGNSATKTIVVTIDPYQQQSGVVAVKQLYRIDGYTGLTIANLLLASGTTTFQFYPADNINIARGLSGRPASKQYANPRIVKESVAVVGGDTIKARLG